MVEGKTKSGFEFKYDERILNDYDLLDAIGRFDNAETKMQSVGALAKIVDYILGDEKEKLMEHIASQNDGFKPIDKVQEEMLEIISKSNELKNSQSSPES